VLLISGDRAFVVVAFSGPPDAITIKGALHTVDDALIAVSFADRVAEDDVALTNGQRETPMIRQWSFDGPGNRQVHIDHWVPSAWWKDVEPLASPLAYQDRQRTVAHSIARAAGWPLPPEPAPSA
jgi:hypothetical protein